MKLAYESVRIHHELPPLPYAPDALEPHLSRETLEVHHGKHHRAYVDALNRLVAGTEFENSPLEELIRNANGAIFNNAAQAWNHSFLWKCMTPDGGGTPQGELRARIEKTFGSVEPLRQLFRKKALELFGSGWIWLVRMEDGRLVVVPTGNANNPLHIGGTALLTCDVWEHAYYLDYRNDRASYMEAFWSVVNWRFVEQNFVTASSLRQSTAEARYPRIDKRTR